MRQYTDVELSLLTNDQIKKLFLSIRSILLQGRSSAIDQKNAEIYLCYITREIENRNL